MSRLELKHLAPYLPYGLSTIFNLNNVSKSNPDEDRVKYLNVDSLGFCLKYCKPILRPLSDLTKEITVNGKKFVPIYKLFELEYKGTNHLENVRGMYFNQSLRFVNCSHFGTAMETSVNIMDLDKNNHWKIKKLHEWHFDTNRLINNGLAIDINTLK